MAIRFNKKMLKLIKKVSKKVAKKLDVDEATLYFGPQTNGKTLICFETAVDDTWAELCFKDEHCIGLENELNNFMKNKKVQWSNRGSFFRFIKD